MDLVTNSDIRGCIDYGYVFAFTASSSLNQRKYTWNEAAETFSNEVSGQKHGG